MIAFVDESVRRVGIGVYVVGCVVMDPGNEAIEDALRRDRPFQFSKADAGHKARMLDMMRQLELRTSAYFLRGLFSAGGEEKARVLCLRRMLQDLMDWDVHDLVLESRRPRQDTFDAITIVSAKRAGLAPDPLAYDWRPKAERRLSMADAVAGALRTTYEHHLVSMGTVIREVRP